MASTEGGFSKYTWSDFDPIKHSVVYWDECELGALDINSLKLALEGQEFGVERKYKDMLKIMVCFINLLLAL